MEWFFPSSNGGRDSGFHDAGVETFAGNFDRFLARELIQNSLDARHDKNSPVEVKFERLKIAKRDLPGTEQLKATFQRCCEYWPRDVKAKPFFERAASIVSDGEIPSLRFSDYNTTGVCGTDKDRDGNWYSLIKCAGASSKWAGEGGSFGIGKNAPFAASQLRTVVYSTRNKDGEYIFQGVATLVSHTLSDGKTASPVGYLGDAEGASVRRKPDIPKLFVRERLGTDIVVLGFDFFDTWEDDLVFSVLDNFWPAIEFEDLVVQVGTITINKTTIGGLMSRFASAEGFTAFHYYNAYKNPTHRFPETLPILGDVTLYLTAGEGDYPKKIMMVRKTGMKIFEKVFRAVMPFCGVFLCRNEKGNGMLREMEPPKHNTWDSDLPTKGSNKKVEAEYIAFIRASLKKLISADDAPIIEIKGLSRFLPDDGESIDQPFDEIEETEKGAESEKRQRLPEKIKGREISVRPKPSRPDHTHQGDGEDETETTGQTWDDVFDDDPPPNDSEDGKPKSGDEGLEGVKDTTQAEHGGVGPKRQVEINYRAFATNPASGVYTLTVSPKSSTVRGLYLAVSAVGDDRKARAPLKLVRKESGEQIPVIDGCVIGPVDLVKGTALKLEAVVRQSARISMDISAYET